MPKKAVGKFQNHNFDNEDIKIGTAPQHHVNFQEGRLGFVPRLFEGRDLVVGLMARSKRSL